MPENQTEGTERVDRRGMLRRAGFVIAGTAGATVAGAVAATPAQAAPGDSVALGEVNDAGDTATTITTNSTANPALVLDNPAVDGAGEGAPQLALTYSTAPNMSSDAPAGSMMLASDSYLMTTHRHPDTGVTEHNHYVYDSWNSSFTAPVNPYRVLDTRSDLSRVFDSDGAFDTDGKVLAGKTIHIDIGDLMTSALGAFVNFVVVQPEAKGYAKLWPFENPMPSSNAINYIAGQTLMNSGFSAIGYDADHTDALSIYTYATTHIIIDITGVVLYHWGSVYGSPLFPQATTAAFSASSKDTGLANRRAKLATKVAEWSKNR